VTDARRSVPGMCSDRWTAAAWSAPSRSATTDGPRLSRSALRQRASTLHCSADTVWERASLLQQQRLARMFWRWLRCRGTSRSTCYGAAGTTLTFLAPTG